MKGQHQFPISIMQKRRLGGTEGSQLEVTGAERPQGYPQNGDRYEERFVAKVFPHSMAAEQYRVAAARLQLLNTNARVERCGRDECNQRRRENDNGY